jgi:predicted PurR-regulated permease PerM
LLLGVPMAFSLGVVAALLDFIPFFGPIVSGTLAVVVAFPEGPSLPPRCMPRC